VLGDFIRHRSPSLGHVDSAIDAIQSARLVAAIVQVLATLAFILWSSRAYRNLIRTGIRDVRFGPGWAVGGWLIPFFNFVRPKQIANDIWKGSVSAGTVGTARWGEIALSGLLNWWWGIWILGAVMIGLGTHAISRAGDDWVHTATNLHNERTGMWFVQIGLVASIVAAVLAILLVRHISRMQDDNFKVVPAWDPDSPSPGHPWATTAPAAAVVARPVAAPAPAAAGTTSCPDCAEKIKAAPGVCRWCGYRFEPPVWGAR